MAPGPVDRLSGVGAGDADTPVGRQSGGWNVEWMCRWSRSERLLRLLRMTWDSGTTPVGGPARSRLTVGLRPALLRIVRGEGSLSVTFAFVRVHYLRGPADRLS